MPIHTVGPFRLNTQHDLLLREGAPVPLGRRAIALLRTLVERPGILVSKDTLIEAAWSGRLVEESNLPVQIAALRRVLGAAPGGDRWIETMPGRGYRFIGPIVTEIEKGAMPPPPQVDTAQEPAPTPRADAERRQITAMSCELIGLSGRADGVGLEDLRDVVGAFQHCVSETVDRHDGLVVSRLGNAVLVLFGYPAAHEYDAERAVRAGLELCTTVRALTSGADLPMRCRVGIATGMAIIGDTNGDGALQDREIIGDAPNRAGRLHLLAQPDIVVIEPATRRLIGNLFDCRDLGTIDTTSGAEPLRIWQVLEDSAAANRFEALRGLALSPLVGRDEEIDILLRRWASAKAGDGQVVLVSGEPGLGKSRLVGALEERLHAEPHFRLPYFCSPYHQDSALYPLIEQLGREAGFARNDMPAARLERLEVLLARAALPHEDVAILADLMSLPASERHPLPNLSPQRQKERTLEALIRQLEGLARHQPVLMVLEDAHWIDPTSRELLDLTVERVPRLPVLLIVTFRPEFQTHWIGQPRVTMLALNRLDRRDRVSLAAQIAGKTLPEIILEQIADRTDGVPLFVEELTKSVLESGLLREEPERYVLDGSLPPFTIPTTLHASLMARLDRLGPAKEVAQMGSAIGREFSHALLESVVRKPEAELVSALDRLVQAGLLSRQGVPPQANYLFKHALVQDAAYGALLREPRRALHARIAETLESQFSEIAESQPEIPAHHCTEAGLIEKAAGLWGKAGQQSLARSALVEAAAQLTRALDQIAILPGTAALRREQIKLQVALITPLMHVEGYAAAEPRAAAEQARSLIEQAEALGEPPEDPLLLFSVLYAFWVTNFMAFNGDVCRDLAAQFLALAEKQRATVPLMVGHRIMGISLVHAGDIAESRGHLDQAIALYAPAEHRPLATRFGQDVGVAILSSRSWALWPLGYPEAALRDADDALRNTREIGQAATLMYALFCASMPYTLCGNRAAAAAHAQELVALAEEKGSPSWQAYGMMNQGCVLALTGRASDAIEMLMSGIAARRTTGTTLYLPFYLPHLARAHAELGQFEAAWRCIGEATTAAETTNEKWCEPEIHRTAGEIALMSPGPDAAKAQAHFERAIAIARAQKAKSWELRAATSLARLRRDQGHHGEARSLLAPVYYWFTEGFYTQDLKDAKALLDCIETVPATSA